jgi:hypothetical protein
MDISDGIVLESGNFDCSPAAVELATMQFMVLTAENYKWEDTPLGRMLVPAEEPTTGEQAK